MTSSGALPGDLPVERNELRGSATRSATLGLASKSLEILTLVALVVLLPRALGAADFGAFALALSVVLLSASSVALGGPTVASRFLAAAPARERASLARGLVVRSAVWRLGAVATGGLVAVAVLVASPGTLPTAATLLVIAAVALDVAATLVLQVGLALGASRAFALRYPLQNVVLVVATLLLHPVLGRPGAVLAIMLASGFALALGLGTTAPLLRGARTARDLPAGLARFAVIQSISGLAVQVVHRGGTILVALLGGTDTEIGFAALAAGIAVAATYVVWQVYTLELPRIVTHEPAAADRSTLHTTWIGLTVAGAASVVGVLVAPSLVPSLLGREYEDAVPAIALALAVVPLAPGAAALNQVAALRMKPESRLLAMSFGFVVFALAALLAIPDHGAVGAAAALVVGTGAAVLAGVAPRVRLLGYRIAALSLAASALVALVAVVHP